MQLYYLQNELNEELNFIVCCEHEDFSAIHEFYFNCYFDVNRFKAWFFNNYKKTMAYLNMPCIIFTKVEAD